MQCFDIYDSARLLQTMVIASLKKTGREHRANAFRRAVSTV